MTKEEALALEAELDKIFTDAIGRECEVSMALTGALRIATSDGFINVKCDTEVVDWVKWDGYYDCLNDFITKSILTIRNTKDKIDRLLKSYAEISD